MKKKGKKPSFLTFQGRMTYREFRGYAEFRTNKIIGRVRSFIFFSNTRNVAMQQLPHRDVVIHKCYLVFFQVKTYDPRLS